MDSRRKFLGKVAGLAGTTIAAVPSRVLGANERVRVGLIGAGDRGTELYRQAMSIPGVEMAAFADVYTRRLEAAKKAVPTAETYLDHRRLLDDKSVDAVLIATPQHLHCEHFVHALEAGKHVYQEKTMAFTGSNLKLRCGCPIPGCQRQGPRTTLVLVLERVTAMPTMRSGYPPTR